MESRETRYGRLLIADKEALFRYLLDQMEAVARDQPSALIGLTGGSTPKAFYDWVRQGPGLSEDLKSTALWSTSDERMVPLRHDDSNFGVADRLLLEPLQIAPDRKLPWVTSVDPHSAARVQNRKWEERFGPGKVFDLCLLGMGDDGHTASLFPGSPLIDAPVPQSFACAEVPGKGWRLTITPAGLQHCQQVLITVTGSGKATRLASVLEGPENAYPVQLLARVADRTTWLVDPAAAAELA